MCAKHSGALDFKAEAMTNFIIKSHRIGTCYASPHIFILNKGLNSGKPNKESYTNSFAIIFQNEEDCENFYFVAFSLWQTRFWHKYLTGSVIPYLRLQDFKKEFNPRAKAIMEEHEQHLKHVAALRLLEQKEKQFQENINLINEMRRVILYRYCK